MDAIERLRDLVEKHFDTAKRWCNQGEARMKAFIEAAGKADPIFRRYEDCWPATRYACQRFRNLKRLVAKRAECRESSFIELDEQTDGEASYREPGGRNAESEVPTLVPEADSPLPLGCLLPGPEPYTGKITTKAHDSTVLSSRVAGKMRIARMSAFRAYLLELEPVLAEYFVQLQLAGVDSEEDLRTLLAFSKREQRRFLKEHCGVTKGIEVFKVCVALARADAKLNIVVID